MTWTPPEWAHFTNGEAPPEDDPEPRHRETKSGTAKFAHELRFGPPAMPVILDTFVAAEGWTVLYANGGTGKGMVTCWLIQQFLLLHVDDDVDVAILDFEDHEQEWGSRLRGIGLTQDQLNRVHYLHPLDLLEKSVNDIKDTHQDFDVGFWVVDSFSYGAASGDKMGGESAAKEFFRAATFLPGIGLVLAHTSDTARHAPKPFGSVVIHNTARETWSAAKNEIDQPYTAPGTITIGPTAKMQIELVNKKRAVGAMTLLPQLLTFTFWDAGRIEVEWTQGKEPSVGDRILDILSDGKSYSGAEIKALLDVDGGKVVDRDTVNKTLGRLRGRSQVVAEGDPLKLRYRWPQATQGQPAPGDAGQDGHTPPYRGGGGVHPSDRNIQMDMSMHEDGQGDGQPSA